MLCSIQSQPSPIRRYSFWHWQPKRAHREQLTAIALACVIVVARVIVVCQVLSAIAITSCHHAKVLVNGDVGRFAGAAGFVAGGVIADGFAVIVDAKFKCLLRGRPTWQSTWRLSHIKFLNSQHGLKFLDILMVWNAEMLKCFVARVACSPHTKFGI